MAKEIPAHEAEMSRYGSGRPEERVQPVSKVLALVLVAAVPVLNVFLMCLIGFALARKVSPFTPCLFRTCPSHLYPPLSLQRMWLNE